MEFHFASPQALFLIALVPVLLWVITRWGRRTLERIQRFSRRAVKDQNSNLSRELNFPTMMVLLAMIFGFLALARPQGNPTEEEKESQSLDIMVLLDLSKSMAAEDAYPNRLQKAKRAVASMLGRLGGDRVGIVGFAGSAVLLSPLTSDYEVLKDFLSAASTDTIENQGTNIEAAIRVAMDAFKRGSTTQVEAGDRSHILVIFSDGEMTTGEMSTALKSIKDSGVRVFAVSIGDTQGVPIPIRDSTGTLQTFKKDRSGNTVLTSMNFKSLDELASAGQGRAFHSSVDDAEIADLVALTSNLQRSESVQQKLRVYEEFYYIPLGIAVALCLLAYASMFLHRRRSHTLIALLIFSAISMNSALAQEPPTDPQGQENPAAPEEPAGLPQTTPPTPQNTASHDFLGDETRKKSAAAKRAFESGKAGESAKMLQDLQIESPNSPEIAYGLGTSLLKAGKVEEGRRLLQEVPNIGSGKQNGDTLTFLSAFNVAGSYAEEKKFDEAAQRYASLLQALQEKQSLNEAEKKILFETQKNLEMLTREEQKQQQQKKDNKDESKPQDQQKKDDQGNQNKKESNQSQSNDDKSKNKDNKNSSGKEDEKPKEDEKKQDDQKKKENEKKEQRIETRRRKEFKENETLSASDAKKLLETLKQQEQLLQKKFLKMRALDRQDTPRNDKDW